MELADFRAESRFGSSICKSNPDVLDGYHILAAPAVSLMQQFPRISAAVSWAVDPWLKYSLERQNSAIKTLNRNEERTEPGWVGSLIHSLGSHVTAYVGRFAKSMFHYESRLRSCSMEPANSTYFVDMAVSKHFDAAAGLLLSDYHKSGLLV
jgi:hypothetical protein